MAKRFFVTTGSSLIDNQWIDNRALQLAGISPAGGRKKRANVTKIHRKKRIYVLYL
jgi:hypothetical protein